MDSNFRGRCCFPSDKRALPPAHCAYHGPAITPLRHLATGNLLNMTLATAGCKPPIPHYDVPGKVGRTLPAASVDWWSCMEPYSKICR